MIKVIALTTMLIDHVGYAFFPELIFLRIIGRIAFPLFALELARGRKRTRSVKRYITKLLLLAAISQIPYILFFETTRFNILFTLLASLLILLSFDKKQYIVAVGIFLLTFILPFEYGPYGPLIVFIIDRIDLNEFKFKVLYFVVNIFSGLQGYAILAYPFFLIRDKKLLPSWVAYSFYPVHLLILYFIAKH